MDLILGLRVNSPGDKAIFRLFSAGQEPGDRFVSPVSRQEQAPFVLNLWYDLVVKNTSKEESTIG